MVEDNTTTAKTITLFLKSEGADVAWAANGSKGLEMAETEEYSAAILDWMLPGIDGVSLCKRLRKTSSIPIIMLTAKTTEDDIVDGLEAGADDYVLKPFRSKELLARLKSALRRRHSFEGQGEDILRLGKMKINTATRQVLIGTEEIKLTKNEYNILSTLAAQPGRIYTRDQLITAALGPDFDGFDRTIDAHVSNLRKKLAGAKGGNKYILTEVGVGYRFQP